MVLTENRVKQLMKEDFHYLVETNKEYFFNLFHEFFIEMIEDKGMLNALNEIPKEDREEADEEELTSIFNGDFITKKPICNLEY